MNKVITVNLNGNAYQLEDGGYETLRAYLETASASLVNNPDRDEIISDIERAIAERFRALLGAYKTVVSSKEVKAVITAVGPIDDGLDPTEVPPPPPPDPARASFTPPKSASAIPDPPHPGSHARKLYRLNEGAMFAGVCQGLAAYFAIDVSLVRIGFIILTPFTVGLAAVAYIVLAFSVPLADTTAEKAAVQGEIPTAQDFIRRAKEGYYEAMKNLPDKEQRREWKKRFQRDMHEWSHNFKHQMQGNASQWQNNWERHWAQGRPASSGAWLMIPVLSVVSVLLFFGCLAGVISLLKTGGILGVMLPVNMPLWVGILILVLIYKMVVWPLKAARYYAWSDTRWGHRHAPPALFADSFIWIAIVIAAAWFVYPQQTKEILQNIPPAVHRASDSLQAWWSHK